LEVSNQIRISAFIGFKERDKGRIFRKWVIKTKVYEKLGILIKQKA